MKKFIALIIMAALLAALCSLTAFASDEDISTFKGTISMSTSEEPNVGSYEPEDTVFDKLEKDYGDVIGGFSVYTTRYDPSKPDVLPGEHIEIYVVPGTGEAVKTEINELFKNATVEFSECNYSLNTLKSVMREVEKMMSEQKDGIVYCCIDKIDKNTVVTVGILKEDYNAASASLTAKYGDKIRTKVSEPIVPYDGVLETEIAIMPDGGKLISPYNPFAIVAICAVVLLLAATVTVVSIRARSRRLALSNGDTAEAGSAITKKDVENKIRESEKAPSEHVYDDIMKQI